MSHRTSTGALATLAALAIFLTAPLSQRLAQAASQDSTKGGVQSTEAVLSVDDVATHPERYKKTVAIRGVVAYVSGKEGIVVLISESEFAACGTTCPEIALPVRWQGDLPSIASHVVVHGQIEKVRKGFLFVSRNAEIVDPGKSK